MPYDAVVKAFEMARADPGQQILRSVLDSREPAPFMPYVCGLLFSDDGGSVVLVRKEKPDWQKGKLNGVGGKIEPGETAIDAMRREFAEETGVTGMPWRETATLDGRNFAVYFFHAFSTAGLLRAKTVETEEIVKKATYLALGDATLMPNLRVIIPLALDNTGIVKPVHMADNT